MCSYIAHFEIGLSNLWAFEGNEVYKKVKIVKKAKIMKYIKHVNVPE